MQNPDPFTLARFLEAQAPVYDKVQAELRSGRKRSHWMWFIFPQLAGLGSSPTARFYAISGLPEAAAYLADPVLGYRLLACTDSVLAIQHGSLQAIFGSPDDLKFRSSMTLFGEAAGRPDTPFRHALVRFCGGEPDGRTLALLRA